MIKNPLLDIDFLESLYKYGQREIYAKIISLDLNENPREEIQGRVQSGSVNINGASYIRRTCSLSVLSADININNFYWTLNTKFKLFIGLKNYINTKLYDDIIWFPMGIFVITNFSQSYTTNNYNLSISGKDKMCLLDGSVNGQLFATHDFGKIENKDDENNTISYDYILIYDIIKNAVHQYANEPYQNIIINDLDDIAVELLDYKVKDRPMYVYSVSKDINFFDYDTQIAFPGLSAIAEYFETLSEAEVNNSKIIPILYEGKYYRIEKKVKYGETAGYRRSDLIFAGDLIIAAGGTVINALDSIVNMLGEFEYFYDVYGRFIFQRKKIYQNIRWDYDIASLGNLNTTQVDTSSNVFEFNQGLLISSFNNTPQILNIKNDFSIWGSLSSATGSELPFHMRYAIDDKPEEYKSIIFNTTFRTQEGQYKYNQLHPDNLDTNDPVDWRELIFLMAWDNLKGKTDALDTPYTAYYVDMLAFWRELYRPSIIDSRYQYDTENSVERKEKQTFKWETSISGHELTEEEQMERIAKWEDNGGWNPDFFLYENNVLTLIAPTSLIFWIDFLDNDSELSKYKVSAIGRRSKTVNDTSIKAMFYRETPNIIFTKKDEIIPEEYGVSYTKVNLPDYLQNYFIISSQGKSAQETLENLLYLHTYYQETISIQAIPIYTLEPNTRITVSDPKSGIEGQYLIISITMPLTYDGMMTITASKIEEAIL